MQSTYISSSISGGRVTRAKCLHGNIFIPPRRYPASFCRELAKASHSAALSSAEPYEFLVKLRNITWETNYVIVSQNALGMMGRRKPLTPRPAPLNVLYYPYIIPTILYN
jgi:hypothetical protein